MVEMLLCLLVLQTPEARICIMVLEPVWAPDPMHSPKRVLGLRAASYGAVTDGANFTLAATMSGCGFGRRDPA